MSILHFNYNKVINHLNTMSKQINLLLCLMVVCSATMLAQSEPPENWFTLDPKDDGVPGVSAELMYERLLKDKAGEPVIVAVLDSGVDPDHEDLKAVMWVNQDEIPDNGKDDDNNGYIDDIHGWNFIGGKDGRNVLHDNLEVTRLYRKYSKMYKDVDATKLKGKKKKQYTEYLKVKEAVEENQEKFAVAAALDAFLKSVKKIKGLINKDEITKEDVQNLQENLGDDPALKDATTRLLGFMEEGSSFAEIEQQLTRQHNYYYPQHKYYYNPDYDPREIVGDNYADSYEKAYGNNDVEGPDAMHGTAVAGTIAADRTNDVGVKGIANNALIMSVRTVPDGDERDKDVANAIRYAVDNGASIVNMSFGKGYSWDKKAVDKAIKYAAKNDVLLVHAAGNDGKENFNTNNFPNDVYVKKGLFGPKRAKNWLEVGAVNWRGGDDLAARFSNYSKDHVDVFAPGVEMYLPVPNDKYRSINGTSFAAPAVAGVAALLRSYFPSLTAEQVREVIMDSSIKPKDKVKQPGTGEMVNFSSLSESGGMLNAFNAIQAAAKVKGKKRVKKTKTNIP